MDKGWVLTAVVFIGFVRAVKLSIALAVDADTDAIVAAELARTTCRHVRNYNHATTQQDKNNNSQFSPVNNNNGICAAEKDNFYR